jgi:hypothetical protein
MSQPDAPLTADDLDIAGRATVYTGDPIVRREDTDGDGKVDRLSVDYDADGDADLIEKDTDGDGRFDDTWVTTNTSSNVSGFADNDGDGHYERVLRDTDGDGVSDGVEEDLDGDGVADRFGLGLGPDDPFGEPEVWVDRLPEPRDGMTSDDAAGFPPLRGPDDLHVPDAAVADPGFGSGADEREMDYEQQEAVNTFADTLQGAPTTAVVDPAPPYEAPAGADHVEDAAVSPVFAPVAEASDVNDAMADPDDDYVG